MAAAFLQVNGYPLKFNDADAFSFLLDLYETGRMRFEELDRWLRQHAAVANPSA
jgi:prophage maintenance system killer protein